MAFVAAFCRDGNPGILRTCHAGAKRSVSKTRNLLYRTYVNMGGAKHLKVLPYQSPPPQAVPLLLLKQEEDNEHVFNILKIKDLSPLLFIEEVAQAKRSDGGVNTEEN